MKLTTQVLVQIAVAAGLYRQDSSAFEAVRTVVRQREQAAWDSESGRRLSTVRDRIESTNRQIAAAVAESEQAEAAHFKSLGGNSDEAIQAARDAVLASQSKVTLLRSEAASLQSIHAGARAAFGQYIETELPKLYAEITTEAGAKQAAAMEAILKILANSDLSTQLKALADGVEQAVIAGSDANALRINCSDLGMSDMFGRKLPPNHVSMRTPEFSALTREERDFAHVRA